MCNMLIGLITSRKSIKKAIRFARSANRLAMAYDHQATLCVGAPPLQELRSSFEDLASKERAHRDDMLDAARTILRAQRLVKAKLLTTVTAATVACLALSLALVIPG